jgi:hypothetical protein
MPSLGFVGTAMDTPRPHALRQFARTATRPLRSLLAMALLLLASHAFAAPPPCDPSGFSGGDGSSEAPFLVQTVENLEYLRDSGPCTTGDFAFLQTADLDFAGTTWTNGIGSITVSPFDGTYDGGGYVIANLVISSVDDEPTGLFNQTSGETLIQNVSLTELVVRGRSQVGGLVGQALATTIRSIRASADVEGAQAHIGGLVGNTLIATVEDVVVQADVRSTGTSDTDGYVGGVVGYAILTNLRNLDVTSSVRTDGTAAGGVAGLLNASSMERVDVDAVIRGKGDALGGAV